MKTGMGIMEISPTEFWAMTPNDFWAIYEARYGKLHKPMTRDELNEALAKHQEFMEAKK